MASTTGEAPLVQAAQLVESKQQADGKFPAISELLHASSSSEYEAAIPAEWQVVTKQRAAALPDALFEQYDLLECRCFMGLFPEIGRAWITVDHRLFLWNYEDETDFYSFEGQEQVIVSVGLVRPRAGVFVEAVTHVLVVATPLEVFLLGVGHRAGARGGEVTLYATQISVPADGVAMTCIAGAHDGRVFMAGNDGGLYEFEYRASDGWLTKRARKVNLTASVASYFVPTFLAGRRDTPALAMAVDDARRLLYVLLQDASIRVYWLGMQGTEFVLAHHHRSIGSAAALLCPQFNEGTDAAPFEIASLHVIPAAESRTLGLVAVTGGGSRVYFSTVQRAQRFYEGASRTVSARPDVFEVVHVRLAPDAQPGAATRSALVPRALHVHAAFYGSGTVLMAHAWSEDHDAVVGAAPASAQILARVARQPRASLVELASAARVEGRTWAIAELDSGTHALNDMATVEGTPTRTFAVLTNAGVTVLEQQRPVDMLRALIGQPSVADAQLREFIATYGLDETCAMSFTLLCADDAAQHAAGMHVLGAARRILFELGGVPRFAEAPAFPTAATAEVPGSERIELSGRHNGLALYLARVLQPIWARAATVNEKTNDSTRIRVGIAIPELVEVQDRLRQLQRFIGSNQRFVPDQLNQMPMQPANSTRPPADATRCWQAEAASLAALYELLVHAIEAISFLCLLADFNLPAISASIPAEQRQALADITFARLVCGERAACKELILALIGSQLRQHVSIDSLSDVLSKRCSSLFSVADVALYRALEALHVAGESEEGAEVAELARDALSLLTGIAGTLTVRQLRDVCASFEALNQHGAVATLALACAAQSDPTDTALAYWGDGAPAGDAREATYRKRMDCYGCVLEMLDKRGAAAFDARALQQLPRDDALFQFVLFDWLLAHAQSALLFHMHAPMVEQYLLVEPRTAEKGDMLWHFYVHAGQYGNAALVQRELACSRDLELSLAQRIEFLSLAISNAKIAVDVVRGGSASHSRMAPELTPEEEVDELGALLRECEDQLEIAQVQLDIQQQLRALGSHETPARALDARLYTVTELYDKFAEPLRLWDAILLIFKASNHDDAQMVEEIWLTILRTVLDDEQRTGLMAVASKVEQLGSRLFPSAAAFPLALIASILVELAQERASEYSVGFVGRTLLQARVPHWAVFEALSKLYTKRVAAANGANTASSEAAELLAREIAALTASWIDSQGVCSTPIDEPSMNSAEGMPVMDVDTALSQYIINATLNSNIDLKNELQRVQDRLRQIF
ncbi:hypothetical protein GGF43_001105 [Coemansia sp. RSA 2618]|nr:hypothetical protein GGF43_001105 [Coemansia sp. RSA 2618]